LIGPKIYHRAPSTSIFQYWIGRLVLRVLRWNIAGEIPKDEKFILIGAPHTSNWDFPIGMAAIYIFRVKISWIGKHTLFKWPYGWFMKWLGGSPVNRENPKGIVQQYAQKLIDADKLVLVLAPAGSRRKKEYWKSGFYRIAVKAKVPIICGYIDYSTKLAGIGPRIFPSGNIKKDMTIIREFYKDKKGKFPELMTDVRVKDQH